MARNIDVTVAAIIERDARFLFVEELVSGARVLNQPAGHLEPGESLSHAVARETLEETGYRFEPTDVVGIYLWQSEAGTTFLRVVFCGLHEAPAEPPRLDEGIIDVHWLSRSQLLARERELRSPLVLRCLNDYAAGVRYPLEVLSHVESGRRASGALAGVRR
jgi:8-oxo-dGTP pyrophosphatase MutT (NUDIX family)